MPVAGAPTIYWTEQTAKLTNSEWEPSWGAAVGHNHLWFQKKQQQKTIALTLSCGILVLGEASFTVSPIPY